MSHFSEKLLDSYSLLIVSKYFIEKDDFINSICVCKKFKETTEKLRFNPIPITSTKLFPKIQTQYLYNKGDIMLKGIDNYEIWYKVNYDDYLKYKEDNIKCHHIVYTQNSTKNNDNTFPKEITMLNKLITSCFKSNNISLLEIPCHVTSLGYGCFRAIEWNFKTITLPTSLTNIHENCFYSCDSLTSIDLPSSIQSIENSCFEYCTNLYSILIPNSVTAIGYGCFDYCTSLQSIILPSSISTLQNCTFNYCYSLTNIELPSSLISIGDYCFQNCTNLKGIKLPTSLEQIKSYSFTCCGIETITIPKFVKVIGVNCFSNCTSLTNINFESNMKKFSFKVSYNDSILYKQFGITCTNIVLTNNCYTNKLNEMQQQNNYLKQFVIPNDIVEIDIYCFSSRSDDIESIIIPTSVKHIKRGCFMNCSITSLSIPSNVQSIGMGCFEECKKLKEVSLPLNEHNNYPFKVSYGDYLILNKFGINCDKIILDDSDFDQCNKRIPTNIPLIINLDYISRETSIQNNIISIKSCYLFKDITSLTIPTNVTYLCDDCFKDYKKLQSITIPTTVKYIGKHLIDGCISLTQFNYEGDWNSMVVSYDDHLKYKSKGLTFNSIEYTNNDCIKYGNVIPLIVHSLHQSYYDRSNEMIHIPTHITSLNNNMFTSNFDVCSKLRSIIIPTSIKTIPKRCFSKCYLLTSVSLLSTLTSIKKKAFNECISLQSITIPISVISIEAYAFKNCYSLTNVILPTPLPLLMDKCFEGCYKLKGILNIHDQYF